MDICGSIIESFSWRRRSCWYYVCADKAHITWTADLPSERVGLHNQTFWMYKFRSMEIQPEAEEKKSLDSKK